MLPTIDIEELLDARHFGRFDVNLFLWSFLAMIADGYDLAGLASAAPALAMAWHLSVRSFAPALSASLAGILFGAPLFGYLGDRFGRKPAIVIASAACGLATLAITRATNLDQIVVLRFLTGIGLGGLMPNVIALSTEFAPKRLRATLVVLAFTGLSVGASLPGAVQAWLIPTYGWHVLFLIGGLVPIAVACCLLGTLPESPRYLALQPNRRTELLSSLQRLRPDLSITHHTPCVTAPGKADGSPIRHLLSARFVWITPLIWISFAMIFMGNYFLNSWLPLILHSNGLTARENGLAILCYHSAGTVGGLLASLVLARHGFPVIALLFMLGALGTAAIGIPGLPYTQLLATVSLAGLCLIGTQFCNAAASGLIYPTTFRSTGVGWALGVGRFGAILGPLAGGVLIGRLSQQHLFMLAALPLCVGLLASLTLAVLWYQQTGTNSILDQELRPSTSALHVLPPSTHS